MACFLVNNLSPALIPGSVSMKDNALLVAGSCHGDLIQSDSMADSDDALGELREEEIVWGEAEIHHYHAETCDPGPDRGNCKVGMAISSSNDHCRPRHRSLLSRQIEMQQAQTWPAASSATVRAAAKQSGEGSVQVGGRIKVGADQGVGMVGREEDQEVGMVVGRGSSSSCSSKEKVDMAQQQQQQQEMNELIPPHELLARQYAASATTCFSVVQGAGRTLKGRDLRRLRNEVWRQTGFVD